jgi:hypothetical protein
MASSRSALYEVALHRSTPTPKRSARIPRASAAACQVDPENRIVAGRRSPSGRSCQRRHRVVLVVEGEVIELVDVVAQHGGRAVLDDRRDLVGERRVVGAAHRNGRREQQAVAVLMLEPFAHESGAAGRGAEDEAAGAGIGRGPDQVADALEPEHRIEDEEREHRHAAGGVARRRSGPRGHRACLGDALLQDRSVGRLLVVQ